MEQTIEYTVVVPVYNSESTLEELYQKIAATLQTYNYEVIFVDDGSKDNSWETLCRLKQIHPDTIRAIRFAKNYGQHVALQCAFSYSRGQFVITIDDDLQMDPIDIRQLILKQAETNAEVVYAVFSNKQHSIVRNAFSSSVKETSKIVAGNTGKGSSFRLIARRVIDTIIANHRNSFIFIDEVLQWYTYSFAYVDLPHYPREKGKSGYTFGKLIKLYLNILSNYSAFPLQLITYAGFMFSFLSFFFGLVFVYRKLMHNVPMGYTSIIVAIFFSSGVIMMCLGTIGQYLFKMYLAYQNKPMYSVKQIL